MKTDFHKIESDILVALSDFLPHNQNQIADLIGKNHKVTSTNRVHVSRCLKELKKYLDRVPNELDELGKKWLLKQDIETIKQIIKTYPSLVSVLQNNKRIVSVVVDKQNLLIKHPLDPYELEDAKKMLSLSWSFFFNYVINDIFLDTFCEMWLDTYREQIERDNLTLDYKKNTDYELAMSDGEKWIFSRPTSPISEILNTAFEHSTISDRINNVYNPKSLDYLKTTFAPGTSMCYPKKPSFKKRPDILKEFRTSMRYIIRPV